MTPPRPNPQEAALALRARGMGCRPLWHDGILGWAFHCTCPGNPHGVDQQCSAITESSLALAGIVQRGRARRRHVEAEFLERAPRVFAVVTRDGGARCDPCALFGSGWDGRSLPRGIDFVDTTFLAPGPLEPIGCPLHGVGCPEWCPVLRAETERNGG